MIALDWSALEVAEAIVKSRDFHFNSTDGASNNPGFQFQNNSTSTFDNELKFAAAQSVRMSIVTLASFNALAALFTVMGICWDSYKAAKRREGQFNLKSSLLKLIGPADTFPFILSLGIIVQGITFAYVQSRGFQSLSILNCMNISQAMLPAMFITPFIQLVLGVEMAIRAVMSKPFSARARWTLPTCILLICLMLLATFLVTIFNRPPNFCFASLFWLVHRWKLGVLIILSLIFGFLIVSVVVIGIRLRSNAKVDDAERLAAYRMVFYLTISILSLACILPFFIQSMIMDLITQAYELSKYGMVASVVANLTGIIIGGCYLFLRTKNFPGVSSKDSFENDKEMYFDQEKSPRTQSANSDDRWLSQLQQPLTPIYYNGSSPTQSPAGETDPILRPVFERRETLQSSTTLVSKSTLASKSLPQVPTIQIPNIHILKSSNGNSMDQERQPSTPQWVLPAATYEPMPTPNSGTSMSSLIPPPMIHSPDGFNHRRGSSIESTATVQIGLRLSNVNDMPVLDQSYRTYREEVHSLDYSNVQGFGDSRRVPSLVAGWAGAGNGSVDNRASTMSVVIAQPHSSVANEGEEIRLSPTVYNPKNPVATQSVASATSRYDDDVVPDPLFALRKGGAWI